MTILVSQGHAAACPIHFSVAVVTSRPRLRIISGSLLLQLGYVAKYMAGVATKVYMEIQDLEHNLWP